MGRSILSKSRLMAGASTIAILFFAMGAGATEPTVIKFKKGEMPPNFLAGKADTDLVEFSGGRRMSVKKIREWAELAKEMRAVVPGSRLHPGLKHKPAATGTPIKTAEDLSAALKRPDSETVKLPSGRLVTVGQIKFLQPEVERRLGRSLASLPQRPDLKGPAIKIAAKSDPEYWNEILDKPDGTILENASGKRITVGELKRALAEKASGTPGAQPVKSGSPQR